MRTRIHFCARPLVLATLLSWPGIPPAQAQAPAANPHEHPDGPHQTVPFLPGDRADVQTTPEPPTIPAAPPPVPVLPAPIVVPTRPVEPPPPPTVTADAEGVVTPTPDGVRVTFAAGSADLNPTTLAAVQALAKAPPAQQSGTFSVVAYAAGTPDDPSTARRLSLSRALAVRSALIESGIPSPRIYVRALGASVPAPAGVPADRVDVAVTLAPPSAPRPAPPPAPALPAAPSPAEKAAP
jgi:outer membrane protein OmpA-like peptidoglycan-associated protein